MMEKLMNHMKKEMEEVVVNLSNELKKIRTGRASLSILDGIKVEYYGNPTPINQVATLSIPSSDTIIIKPWETNMFPKIEKAIIAANIGISPINDGKQIRLQIPPLDEERRRELVKKVKKYLEERKASLRNIRREYRDKVKKLKDDKEISEDDEHKLYDKIQETLNDFIKKLDDIAELKEKEIMEI